MIDQRMKGIIEVVSGKLLPDFLQERLFDPVKTRIYLLMFQRADIGNSDASEMRRAFQNAAAH